MESLDKQVIQLGQLSDKQHTEATEGRVDEGGGINPLRAKLFRGNINIYLHFMSFLHTNKTQVLEIPPRVRQGPAYFT